MSEQYTARVFVVRDNIDTDQIIPAQYLALVPTNPAEYEQLGRYALIGLPDDQYPIKFVPPGETKSPYGIVIGGRNFGCGSSREHAPIALGAAGVRAVVAEAYARIFFRNCVATGEVFPYDSTQRLCDIIKTGDEATIDFSADTLTHNGTTYALKPLGEVRPVVEAGGIFAYARQTGMIPSRAEPASVGA
jgi:3-isopropylmalate/(R)-2-methylmalate dehydratase small subunit